MKRENWIAYRLGALEHKVEQLERSLASAKATAKRIGLLLGLWTVAILSNMNTEEVTDAIAFAMKIGLRIF